jgi:hypothetical protein
VTFTSAALAIRQQPHLHHTAVDRRPYEPQRALLAAIARIAGNMSHALASRFVLQALALQDNVIESLPMTFVNLSNLTTLDLGGNKMQGIPVNVLQGGPQAVLQFMRYNCRYDS